jgi:hypothetical protein
LIKVNDHPAIVNKALILEVQAARYALEKDWAFVYLA